MHLKSQDLRQAQLRTAKLVKIKGLPRFQVTFFQQDNAVVRVLAHLCLRSLCEEAYSELLHEVKLQTLLFNCLPLTE